MLKAVGGDNAPEADGTFGALNVLKVTEITDADGQAVEGVPVVHLLPTASASSLLSGDAKPVTVNGVLFKDCLTLQVDEVVGDAAGDDDGFDDWDEIGITTMSQQAII